ncbi:Beta-lactamase, partial [Dysosmobacter welbionis]
DIILHYLGIQAVAEDGPPGGIYIKGLHLPLLLLKVHGGQQLTGTAGDGLLALQDHPLQLLGEPACRLAHHTGEVADNTVREGQALALLHDVLRGQVVLGHEDG